MITPRKSEYLNLTKKEGYFLYSILRKNASTVTIIEYLMQFGDIKKIREDTVSLNLLIIHSISFII